VALQTPSKFVVKTSLIVAADRPLWVENGRSFNALLPWRVSLFRGKTCLRGSRRN
jgi:hypothetical protein